MARTDRAWWPYQPPAQWGLSSRKIFKLHISVPTWLGCRRADRRVPIYNFVNRVSAPRDSGYSTRVTFARDFRGGLSAEITSHEVET